MRNINIRKVMNGYVVEVGCQTLVFETKEKLVTELATYLANPDEVERNYISTYGMLNQLAGAYPAPTPASSAPPVGQDYPGRRLEFTETAASCCGQGRA